jgi:hypothetical protein
MRSAGVGPELKIKLEAIAKALGPYPHGKLKVTHRKVISRSRPRAKFILWVPSPDAQAFFGLRSPNLSQRQGRNGTDRQLGG